MYCRLTYKCFFSIFDSCEIARLDIRYTFSVVLCPTKDQEGRKRQRQHSDDHDDTRRRTRMIPVASCGDCGRVVVVCVKKPRERRRDSYKTSYRTQVYSTQVRSSLSALSLVYLAHESPYPCIVVRLVIGGRKLRVTRKRRDKLFFSHIQVQLFSLYNIHSPVDRLQYY